MLGENCRAYPVRQEARIHIIGMEPEGLSTRDLRFSRLFSHCALLVGGDRQLKTLDGPLPPNVERLTIRGKMDPIVDRLQTFQESLSPEVAIVLASGDPLYHGIGSTLIRKIGREKLAFYPAPTLVQRAFSLLGLPWEDSTVVSFHRPDSPERIPETGKSCLLAFYTDGAEGPRKVLSAINKDLALQKRLKEIAVLENIGLEDQAITVFERERADMLQERKFAPLNVVVVTLNPAD
ncbi:MAG: precorrin-6y C5,15-methyltransferase (decarboxylating) subunit CbiE [Leptospirillum sp.]